MTAWKPFEDRTVSGALAAAACPSGAKPARELVCAAPKVDRATAAAMNGRMQPSLSVVRRARGSARCAEFRVARADYIPKRRERQASALRHAPGEFRCAQGLARIERQRHCSSAKAFRPVVTMTTYCLPFGAM